MGLTLHEIGCVLSRSLVGVDEEPSQLERLCSSARQSTRDLSASEASSDSASVSDFIAESWEEAEDASQDQDSPLVRACAGLGASRSLRAWLTQPPAGPACCPARAGLTPHPTAAAAGVLVGQPAVLLCIVCSPEPGSQGRLQHAEPRRCKHRCPGRGCSLATLRPCSWGGSGRAGLALTHSLAQGIRRELQFELDSESEASNDRPPHVHLHGMPLPLGKQISTGAPGLSVVSPASLSPLSSRSSAFTVFPKKCAPVPAAAGAPATPPAASAAARPAGGSRLRAVCLAQQDTKPAG